MDTKNKKLYPGEGVQGKQKGKKLNPIEMPYYAKRKDTKKFLDNENKKKMQAIKQQDQMLENVNLKRQRQLFGERQTPMFDPQLMATLTAKQLLIPGQEDIQKDTFLQKLMTPQEFQRYKADKIKKQTKAQEMEDIPKEQVKLLKEISTLQPQQLQALQDVLAGQPNQLQTLQDILAGQPQQLKALQDILAGQPEMIKALENILEQQAEQTSKPIQGEPQDVVNFRAQINDFIANNPAGLKPFFQDLADANFLDMPITKNTQYKRLTSQLIEKMKDGTFIAPKPKPPPAPPAPPVPTAPPRLATTDFETALRTLSNSDLGLLFSANKQKIVKGYNKEANIQDILTKHSNNTIKIPQNLQPVLGSGLFKRARKSNSNLSGKGFFGDLVNKAKDKISKDPLGSLKQSLELAKKGVDGIKQAKSMAKQFGLIKGSGLKKGKSTKEPMCIKCALEEYKNIKKSRK